MRRGLTAAGLLFLAVLCCLSCAERSHSLPADWPIPELTVPLGAVLTSRPSVRDSARTNRKISAASLRVTSSWEDVAAHVERCLAPLGYVEWVDVHPGGTTIQDRYRGYWAHDGKTNVELLLNTDVGHPEVAPVITQHNEPQVSIESAEGHVYDSGIRVEIRPLQ